MKFDTYIYEYLDGKKFSNGLQIKISKKKSKRCNRLNAIENLCTDKDVIHLGCADHLNLIDEKLHKGTWLHDRLYNCSNYCIGIDINHESIEYIRQFYNYENLICADIISDQIDGITSHRWDYLVMGEILEHVNDPCYFLTQIHNKYSMYIKHLIITVPNALCLQNIRNTFSNQEIINTDHKYWFTPYTLAKVITNAGMEVEDFYFCQDPPIYNSTKEKLFSSISPYQIIMDYFPATRMNLIMVAKL